MMPREPLDFFLGDLDDAGYGAARRHGMGRLAYCVPDDPPVWSDGREDPGWTTPMPSIGVAS
jgi:hypothetical protein